MGKDDEGILICFNEGGFIRIRVITIPLILVASPNCLAFSNTVSSSSCSILFCKLTVHSTCKCKLNLDASN